MRPAGCSFNFEGMGGSVGTGLGELGGAQPLRAPDGGQVSGSVGGMDRVAGVVRGRLAAGVVRVLGRPLCFPDLEPDGFLCFSGMRGS